MRVSWMSFWRLKCQTKDISVARKGMDKGECADHSAETVLTIRWHCCGKSTSVLQMSRVDSSIFARLRTSLATLSGRCKTRLLALSAACAMIVSVRP